MPRQDNFLYTQYKRELGSYKSPVRVQYKILRSLMESDNWKYKKIFDTNSHKRIYYKDNIVHLEENTTIKRYGPHDPVKFCKIQKGDERGRIIDAMYSVNLNPCVCRDKKCLCGKKYIYCLTLDQWLLKCNFETGELIEEINVNTMHHKFGFSSCNWSGLNDLYVLKSFVDYEARTETLLYMAVFNSSLKVMYFFNVERKVFGKDCKDAFLADQLFVTRCRNRFLIYSFEDVINEGVFVSNVPLIGLEINFQIKKAPAVLYAVYCLRGPFVFGGFPYHCIFPQAPGLTVLANLDKREHDYVTKFRAKSVKFLPMSSNKIVVQTNEALHCHEVIPLPNSVHTTETFVLEFPELLDAMRGTDGDGYCGVSVFAVGFENSLDLIGILGIHKKDALRRGFVKLFDKDSGKEVKSIKLNKILYTGIDYSLHVDLGIVVVLDKANGRCYLARGYALCSSLV